MHHLSQLNQVTSKYRRNDYQIETFRCYLEELILAVYDADSLIHLHLMKLP